MKRPVLLTVFGITALITAAASLTTVLNAGPAAAQDETAAQRDPAAWGDDHVGKDYPNYMVGGECLFCHRYQVGDNWQRNRHGQTMHGPDPGKPAMQALSEDEDLGQFAKEVRFLLGDTRSQRYLKRSETYGQMALLSAEFKPGAEGESGELVHGDSPHWDQETFAKRCAGCHTTAVEPETQAYSTISLDCFVCHGNVPAEHQSKTSMALYGEGNEAGALVETAICASCHLRGGESESTGLPYPNTFVPGDNVFKDFQADLSPEHIESLNVADRHVYQNVRDVVIEGKEEMTCVTCHDIHTSSSRKHRTLRRLQREQYCATCHTDLDNYAEVINYEVHSQTCMY